MKWISVLICISVIAGTVCFSLEKSISNNRFTIESKRPFTETLLKELSSYDLAVLHKITESVYIFKNEGLTQSEIIQDLIMSNLRDQVDAIEPTRIYVNTILPATSNGNNETSTMTNLVCDHYYGLGVDKVWARNITGLGVTIAINDVGIDTDLDDLEPNINKELSMDLFNNKPDVTPEHFKENVEYPSRWSAHGNHVASVVAAVKGNNLCSSGIAYNATVVGIKALMIKLKEPIYDVETKTEIISRSFNYDYDKIDIYVNALGAKSHFEQLDIAARRAIQDAALKGRKGRGAIHVVPAGTYGNAFSNNHYIITVNGIPKPGKALTEVSHDASVLTSGLWDGNYLTSSSMVNGNKCVRSFSGVSAAVAQVSGIIAFGLQAKPSLKLRDVQHLLVQASGYEKLIGRVKFDINGASRKYSDKFGFGLINADKFVSLAIHHMPVPDLQSRDMFKYEKRSEDPYKQIYEFCYSCKRERSCLNLLEHVALNISFVSFADHVKLSLISLSGTVSLLMDLPAAKANLSHETHRGNFVSVHFWDEVPFGKWQVKVQSIGSSKITIVSNISITLHGTKRAYLEEDPGHCGSEETIDNSNDTTYSSDDSTNSPDWTPYIAVGIFVLVVLAVVILLYFMKPYTFIMNRDNSQRSYNTYYPTAERERLPTSMQDTHL